MDASMDFDNREELIGQFAKITHLDKEASIQLLQKHDYDLPSALATYFDSQSVIIDLTEEEYFIGDEDKLSKDPQHSRLFRVLSWNIEGLNTKSLETRIEATVEQIMHDIPHIVCLQEVIPMTQRQMESSVLSNHYHFISPPTSSRIEYGYYVLILVRKACGITIIDQRCEEFKNTDMGRHVVAATLQIKLRNSKKILVHICTSHLESCAEYAAARKEQLKICWEEMEFKSQTPEAYSIFCGDLNIRDSEISALGGVPKGFKDVWAECGARKEARVTWDPKRNTNISMRHANGCHFDRMYYTAKSPDFRAVDFELRGLHKVPRSTLFPSDHWAILGHFLLS